MSRFNTSGENQIVHFRPGQPAPWDDALDTNLSTDCDANSRQVTWSLSDLVGAYSRLRRSYGATVSEQFSDGTCLIDVRRMERGFGVHLLGYIQALNRGPRFTIELDSGTVSALAAHWERMIPCDLVFGELHVKRASWFAVHGIEQLLSVIADSVVPVGCGPYHYSEWTIEGIPSLPIALLDHRYKEAHKNARRALVRVRMDMAKRAILLLHPGLSPEATCTLKVPFEPRDPDDLL